MTSRFKTRVFSSHFLEVEVDGVDIELPVTFEPVSYIDVLVKMVGNQLVLAYLVNDSDAGDSPLEAGTANGEIFTVQPRYARNSRVTDNDHRILSALGLTHYGEPNLCKLFHLNGEKATLFDLAMAQFVADLHSNTDLQEELWETLDLPTETDFAAWSGGEPNDGRYPTNLAELEAQVYHGQAPFYERVEEMAVALYRTHWRTIAGPFVVPIAASGSRYWATSWDGDTDDMPDGIWVADNEAEENITTSAYSDAAKIRWAGAVGSASDPCHAIVMVEGQVAFDAGPDSGSWGRALKWVEQKFGPADTADVIRAATEYAESVLKEYSLWAEGEVYGCFVALYEQQEDGQWEMTKDESCWRFIGSEWAEEALKSEFFDPFVQSHLTGDLITEGA